MPCQITMPSATQNELSGKDAKSLIRNGVIAVGEGANMPLAPKRSGCFARRASASDRARPPMPAGLRPRRWRCSKTPRAIAGHCGTEAKLAEIMRDIHDSCYATTEEYGVPGDYVIGANIAGFVRVAEPMLAFGVI